MSSMPNMLMTEDSLNKYIKEVKRIPMLAPDEEFELARRWREHADREAAHKLVTSHLRLAVKMAMGFRGYGLPLPDVIAEANVGLMEAVRRFEPDKGFKLATYAMWWIRASIQEYILKSWSLVKMGTTSSQKKLFFGLKKAKSKISALGDGDLTPEQVELIATNMSVSKTDVIDMNRRMSGDLSLNSPLSAESESERQDWLVDETDSQETLLADHEEASYRHEALMKALTVLKPRELLIFKARRLSEEPVSLQDLGVELGVSRERIRQIEVVAFNKVKKEVERLMAITLEPSARTIRDLPMMTGDLLRIEAPRSASFAVAQGV